MLSIVVNSAGCERVFSHFGITHTKRRSRLSLEKVQKTAIVKMDLQRSHPDLFTADANENSVPHSRRILLHP
ncbi:hypothetical protein F5888DRAFT_1706201 [Russula emetica]|nr:hypothetical protein F5888DRAFT_1784157 [Russula emetica]KAF8495739.1 hypothetical protein F5888DRAFT_1709688 [Russula emetica]KAF8496183.1 hypothetical protein F5888DRAFT_1706201 [Russula emetica]